MTTERRRRIARRVWGLCALAEVVLAVRAAMGAVPLVAIIPAVAAAFAVHQWVMLTPPPPEGM